MEDIEDVVREYFEKLTSDIDIDTREYDAIDERINLLVEDIRELIEETKDDIENIKEEFSDDNILEIKRDLKYQERKEADLWS